MKVYYANVDDNDDLTGMNAISLVEFPAVDRDFLCFNEQLQLRKKTEPIIMRYDAPKKVITGVVCLADTPLYRHSEDLGDYWVVFTKENIERMVVKYSKRNMFNRINLHHDDKRFVDGLVLIESYMVNKGRGICPNEFKDVPNGTWICSFKVEDDSLWNDIITSGKLNGFSLQGNFLMDDPFPLNYKKIKTHREKKFDDWVEEQLKNN